MHSANPISQTVSPLKKIKGFLPKNALSCFLSAVVVGLIVHLFMFTNKLPNVDDLAYTRSFGESFSNLASGRFLLGPIFALTGNVSSPMLIGVLSLLMIGCSAVLVVDVLRIRNRFLCMLTGALMAVFPSVSTTFAYMFTSFAYFLSFFLVCLGVYLVRRLRWIGLIFGSILVFLSLGIYQAYLPFAAGLYCMSILVDILEGETDKKALLLEGLRMVLLFSLGVALYFLCTNILLSITGVELNSYQGLSSMGGLPIAQLPSLILHAYREIAAYFFLDSFQIHGTALSIVFVVGGALSVGMLIWLVWKKKLYQNVFSFLVFLLLLVALPAVLAANYILASQGVVHLLMLYSYALVLIFPLALLQQLLDLGDLRPGQRCLGIRGCYLLCALLLCMSGFSFASWANRAYLQLHFVYEQEYAYGVKLSMRIEETEGFVPDMPICFVGRQADSGIPATLPNFHTGNPIGIAQEDYLFLKPWANWQYLRYYLGTSVTAVKPGQVNECAEKYPEILLDMPLYPAEGSIRVLDGVLFVKIGNITPEDLADLYTK